MALDTWGDKPENQTSVRLILEAIADLISAHEADPDAHLEVGESLQSHKASEIIDHLAYSIVRDKLTFDRYSIDHDFQTVDYWTLTNGCGIENINELQIYSSSVLSETGYAILPTGDAFQDQTSWAKNPNWQIRAYFSTFTGWTANIGMFDEDIVSGIGFRVIDGVIYAVWFDADDVEQTHELMALSTYTPYILRWCRNDVTGLNEWYINGALVHSVTVFPVTNVTSYCYFSLINDSTTDGMYYISNFHYDSDF